MTFILLVLVGSGFILVSSALDNSSIADTVHKIINGDQLDFSGQTINPSNPPQAPIATASTMSWVNYAVTQPYGKNGETGIDIGTPQDTPLGALEGGTVVSTSYGPEGGDVWVKVKQGVSYLYHEYVHLDNILVAAGQSIVQGQILGLSGGQLSGGLHNAQPPYSTGPHTEFGIYRGFKQPSTSIDPTAFINSIRQQTFAGPIS